MVTRSAFRRSHEQHLIPASQQTPARAEWFWRVARFVARDVRLDATPRKGFRCGLVSRPANSYHPFKVAAESREELALHRALRRMAGLVFLLVFWVLAGACQRHGVGGFLSFNSPSPSRFCRGAWWPAGTTTGNREREKDREGKRKRARRETARIPISVSACFSMVPFGVCCMWHEQTYRR